MPIAALPYDHPNFVVRREQSFLLVAGTGVKAAIAPRQKFRLKGLNYRVQTAGTAAGFVLQINNGTTSVAASTVGTLAAGAGTGSIAGISLGTNAICDAGNMIAAQIVGDATGVLVVNFEYEVLPDAQGTD